MRVFVYYNLTKKCWSIKALEGRSKGRVVAHADAVDLWDCKFKVSEAGRQRVLRTKQKNVHAGVEGTLVWMDGRNTKAGMINDRFMPEWYAWRLAVPNTDYRITYNPYVSPTFHIKRQEGVAGHDHWHLVDLRCRAVHSATHVLLGYNRDLWAELPVDTTVSKGKHDD